MAFIVDEYDGKSMGPSTSLVHQSQCSTPRHTYMQVQGLFVSRVFADFGILWIYPFRELRNFSISRNTKFLHCAKHKISPFPFAWGELTMHIFRQYSVRLVAVVGGLGKPTKLQKYDEVKYNNIVKFCMLNQIIILWYNLRFMFFGVNTV